MSAVRARHRVPLLGIVMQTPEEIELEAELCYYDFTRARGLQYPWDMLDENTKQHWRDRVATQ